MLTPTSYLAAIDTQEQSAVQPIGWQTSQLASAVHREAWMNRETALASEQADCETDSFLRARAGKNQASQISVVDDATRSWQ